ncbi:DUF4184 family protein [Cognatilysobacter bugurensis]|uniref:DUF4184 family protein n=1 Tax=Cognatilysobacter bugurensis TaxID=543356 RepID=A0A918W7W5_9GAMM|nr:DUF4184 family protein [Lysobacter bugurensis]GHA83111.1 hypothetical protein GCM10007067_21530 [Lysobacter bugurensis]
MPLTPSHAAAALLLERTWPRMPLAALVIGSMSPDFEYLLRLIPRGEFGHTPMGLLLFCLPVGLVVWGVYRAWIRPMVHDLLPPGLSAGTAPRCDASWSAGALAVLLGAVSHVTWDAFTHADGFFVGLLPPLASVALPAVLSGLRWYQLLQHASTAVGALVIAWVAVRWWRNHPAADRRFAPRQARRAVAAVVVLSIVSGLGAVLNGARVADRDLAVVLGYAAVGTMVGFALASVALAAYWHGVTRAD